MTQESTLALALAHIKELIEKAQWIMHPANANRSISGVHPLTYGDLVAFSIPPLPPPSSTAQEPVARRQAIAQCIETIRPWTVGAFTGWQGKTGDFKITLDEAEDHFSLCMMDMMEDVRALLYAAPLETPSREALAKELMAFHDACTQNAAGGDGEFRVECSSGSSEQARALRAVLREAATALAALPPPADTGQLREALEKLQEIIDLDSRGRYGRLAREAFDAIAIASVTRPKRGEG